MSNKNTLLKDLADTSRAIEISVREYEQTYGERFVINNNTLVGPPNNGTARPAPGGQRQSGSPSGRQGENAAGLVNNVASVLSTPVQRPTGRGMPQSRPGGSFH